MKKIPYSVRVMAVFTAAVILLCLLCTVIFGRTVTLSYFCSPDTDYSFEIEDDVLEIVSVRREGNRLYVKLRQVKASSSSCIGVLCEHDQSEEDQMINNFDVVYLHPFGVLTGGTYFGECSCDPLYFAAEILIFLAAFFLTARAYRRSVRKDLCRYRNIILLGMMIFLLFNIIVQIYLTVENLAAGRGFMSLYNIFSTTAALARTFSLLVMPAAFITSVLVTFSHIILMRREGVTWRNMLGTVLGLVICAGTVFSMFIYGIFRVLGVDVNYAPSKWNLAERITEDIFSLFITYLECVLLGTIISSLRAARHVPAFDKDYILILGCQIRKDGGLTKLLQSRTDRALEFARMQKQATGRDITFVPSGGKGDDEVMAEGEAIANYLREQGIPGERILTENKSVNTYENITLSQKLIEEKGGGKAAFSTTNYHVFRAGCIADRAGFPMEGIGAKTKAYFWINAFIREFIAALSSEKRTHLKMLLLLILVILPMELLIHYSDCH
ncbi:YdcF family protein [Ruminococcus sp.]|uniref:YdcF family protein n=1 Tax=Ruminococcus sp. TaxID=41978 RepID=UPI0025D8B301|nr:YdcF family protein [Ruminococcus sp.]MBQ8966902.1 YdcF family protein [Ruminococcus sp.]